MSDPTPLGARIAAARNALGLSQSQLSRDTEVHQRTISDIERGEIKRPGFAITVKLANHLGISVDELLELASEQAS